MRVRWRLGAAAFASFVLVALLQSWPLPLHLGTAFTGHPAGDTGTYVWNQWIFRHELIEHGRVPFRTPEILAIGGPADLSLHNYTIFANLLALPLLPLAGVVTTFNLIYLFNVALAGFGMFLLAHRLTGRVAESWLAGVLFACSPFLVARSLAHFSLVAAAPLPFFLYWLDRAWTSSRLAPAAAAGACVAWAWASDPYYAIYCVMLGGLYVGAQIVSVEARRSVAPARRHVHLLLDAMAVALASLIAAVVLLGGRTVRLGSLSLSVRSLYTPVLILTALVGVRLLLTIRPRVVVAAHPPLRPLVRLTLVSTAAAVLLLSPELVAIGRRVADGRLVRAPVQWRSGPPGVDVLSFVAPNPHHPLAPRAIANWIDQRPGLFHEQVASVPFVVLGVLVFAWRRGFRPRRFWVVLTAGFALLALGPFIHVGGINTHVPGPWVLLRYVPVIDAARMPPRFTVVVILGFAMLLASALAWLTSQHPARRRTWLATVGAILAFELLPAPRTLHSAAVPGVFHRIASDPRPVRVLTLPAGVRDGLSSDGDFSAASLYYQTTHGKAILDGALSRVSLPRKLTYRSHPMMHALLELSEGDRLRPAEAARARREAEAFLRRTDLGYVVLETRRVSADLRRFAIDTLGLVRIDERDGFELYVPQGR